MVRSISVALTPDSFSGLIDADETCSVVIDVLRATSVMATAGHAGIMSIVTCEDIDAAQAIARAATIRPLLCGERHCKPIPGFDLGNSPAEYTSQVVASREMVLTTTNGTRAIMAVMSSRRLLVASFLNLSSTIAAISTERQLQIVCAGTNGEVSFEDVLLAGALVDRLVGADAADSESRIDDSARIAWSVWSQAVASDQPLGQTLRLSLGGRNLIAAGYDADIERCARIDTVPGIVERIDRSETRFAYRADLSAE